MLSTNKGEEKVCGSNNCSGENLSSNVDSNLKIIKVDINQIKLKHDPASNS